MRSYPAWGRGRLRHRGHGAASTHDDNDGQAGVASAAREGGGGGSAAVASSDICSGDCAADPTGVTCVICQDDFTALESMAARPCDHKFCGSCIERWVESCSQCPLCKQEIFGLVSAAQPECERVVKPRRFELQTSAEEGFDVPEEGCQICGGCDQEDLLLLCDLCDRAYHIFCLTPQLAAVPEGHWHCPHCTERLRGFVGRPAGRGSFLGLGAAGAAASSAAVMAVTAEQEEFESSQDENESLSASQGESWSPSCGNAATPQDDQAPRQSERLSVRRRLLRGVAAPSPEAPTPQRRLATALVGPLAAMEAAAAHREAAVVEEEEAEELEPCIRARPQLKRLRRVDS